MMLLFWLVVLFLGVQLLTLLTNLLFFPVLRKTETAPAATRVSLLIPARNEAANLPETLPRILAQREATEILVLDDGSTDGTGEILESFTDPRLRILKGRPLPEGWSGKNWACHGLAEAATGDLLIFTDADVVWEAGTLAALLRFWEDTGAQYVSVWPRQLTLSFWERVTVPLIDIILLGSLPYLGVKYVPLGAFSAGNGQLMLWTRDAYRGLGGHAAFRGEVLEDVRMGQAAKAAGYRVALAVGGKMISTRMYRKPSEILVGFSKNILAAHGNSRPLLVLSLLLNTLAYTLVWCFALFNPLWLLPAVMGLGIRLLTCLKTGRNPFEFPLQPLMALPLWLICLRALRRAGSYEWKGRVYGS